MDRKVHIIKPLKNLALTKHRKIRVASIWAFSLAISTPFLFSAHINRPLNGVSRNTSVTLTLSRHISAAPRFVCIISHEKLRSQISFTIYFLLAFVAPLSIITHSYGKIFMYLRKRAAQRRRSACYIRSKYKALRMLLIIVISFLFSWGPVMFSDLATAFGVMVRTENIPIKKLVVSISLTSSVINPLLYSFGNAYFRWEVVRVFRGCKTSCTFA